MSYMFADEQSEIRELRMQMESMQKEIDFQPIQIPGINTGVTVDSIPIAPKGGGGITGDATAQIRAAFESFAVDLSNTIDIAVGTLEDLLGNIATFLLRPIDVSELLTDLQNLTEAQWESVTVLIAEMRERAESWWNTTTDGLIVWLRGIDSGLRTNIRAAADFIGGLADDVKLGLAATVIWVSGLSQEIRTFISGITPVFITELNTTVSWVIGLGADVRNFVSDTINWFKGLISEVRDFLTNATAALITNLNITITWVTGLSQTVRTFITGLTQDIINEINTTKDWAIGLGADVRNFVSETVNWFKGLIATTRTFITNLTQDIINEINTTKDWAIGLGATVRNAISDTVNWFLTIPSNVVSISNNVATWFNTVIFGDSASHVEGSSVGDVDMGTYDLLRVDRLFFESNDGIKTDSTKAHVTGNLNDLRYYVPSTRSFVWHAGTEVRMGLSSMFLTPFLPIKIGSTYSGTDNLTIYKDNEDVIIRSGGEARNMSNIGQVTEADVAGAIAGSGTGTWSVVNDHIPIVKSLTDMVVITPFELIKGLFSAASHTVADSHLILAYNPAGTGTFGLRAISTIGAGAFGVGDLVTLVSGLTNSAPAAGAEFFHIAQATQTEPERAVKTTIESLVSGLFSAVSDSASLTAADEILFRYNLIGSVHIVQRGTIQNILDLVPTFDVAALAGIIGGLDTVTDLNPTTDSLTMLRGTGLKNITWAELTGSADIDLNTNDLVRVDRMHFESNSTLDLTAARPFMSGTGNALRYYAVSGQAHIWYIGNTTPMTILPAEITVNFPLKINGGYAGTDNGVIWIDNNDIKVRTGGLTRNLTSIGTASGVWDGNATFDINMNGNDINNVQSMVFEQGLLKSHTGNSPFISEGGGVMRLYAPTSGYIEFREGSTQILKTSADELFFGVPIRVPSSGDKAANGSIWLDTGGNIKVRTGSAIRSLSDIGGGQAALTPLAMVTFLNSFAIPDLNTIGPGLELMYKSGSAIGRVPFNRLLAAEFRRVSSYTLDTAHHMLVRTGDEAFAEVSVSGMISGGTLGLFESLPLHTLLDPLDTADDYVIYLDSGTPNALKRITVQHFLDRHVLSQDDITSFIVDITDAIVSSEVHTTQDYLLYKDADLVTTSVITPFSLVYGVLRSVSGGTLAGTDVLLAKTQTGLGGITVTSLLSMATGASAYTAGTMYAFITGLSDLRGKYLDITNDRIMIADSSTSDARDMSMKEFIVGNLRALGENDSPSGDIRIPVFTRNDEERGGDMWYATLDTIRESGGTFSLTQQAIWEFMNPLDDYAFDAMDDANDRIMVRDDSITNRIYEISPYNMVAGVLTADTDVAPVGSDHIVWLRDGNIRRATFSQIPGLGSGGLTQEVLYQFIDDLADYPASSMNRSNDKLLLRDADVNDTIYAATPKDLAMSVFAGGTQDILGTSYILVYDSTGTPTVGRALISSLPSGSSAITSSALDAWFDLSSTSAMTAAEISTGTDFLMIQDFGGTVDKITPHTFLSGTFGNYVSTLQALPAGDNVDSTTHYFPIVRQSDGSMRKTNLVKLLTELFHDLGGLPDQAPGGDDRLMWNDVSQNTVHFIKFNEIHSYINTGSAAITSASINAWFNLSTTTAMTSSEIDTGADFLMIQDFNTTVKKVSVFTLLDRIRLTSDHFETFHAGLGSEPSISDIEPDRDKLLILYGATPEMRSIKLSTLFRDVFEHLGGPDSSLTPAGSDRLMWYDTSQDTVHFVRFDDFHNYINTGTGGLTERGLENLMASDFAYYTKHTMSVFDEVIIRDVSATDTLYRTNLSNIFNAVYAGFIEEALIETPVANTDYVMWHRPSINRTRTVRIDNLPISGSGLSLSDFAVDSSVSTGDYILGSDSGNSTPKRFRISELQNDVFGSSGGGNNLTPSNMGAFVDGLDTHNSNNFVLTGSSRDRQIVLDVSSNTVKKTTITSMIQAVLRSNESALNDATPTSSDYMLFGSMSDQDIHRATIGAIVAAGGGGGGSYTATTMAGFIDSLSALTTTLAVEDEIMMRDASAGQAKATTPYYVVKSTHHLTTTAAPHADDTILFIDGSDTGDPLRNATISEIVAAGGGGGGGSGYTAGTLYTFMTGLDTTSSADLNITSDYVIIADDNEAEARKMTPNAFLTGIMRDLQTPTTLSNSYRIPIFDNSGGLWYETVSNIRGSGGTTDILGVFNDGTVVNLGGGEIDTLNDKLLIQDTSAGTLKFIDAFDLFQGIFKHRISGTNSFDSDWHILIASPNVDPPNIRSTSVYGLFEEFSDEATGLSSSDVNYVGDRILIRDTSVASGSGATKKIAVEGIINTVFRRPSVTPALADRIIIQDTSPNSDVIRTVTLQQLKTLMNA